MGTECCWYLFSPGVDYLNCFFFLFLFFFFLFVCVCVFFFSMKNRALHLNR